MIQAVIQAVIQSVPDNKEPRCKYCGSRYCNSHCD